MNLKSIYLAKKLMKNEQSMNKQEKLDVPHDAIDRMLKSNDGEESVSALARLINNGKPFTPMQRRMAFMFGVCMIAIWVIV